MALIFEKESWAIKGCAFEVMKRLGSGFTEYVYQDALAVEFRHAGVPYEKEKHLNVTYRDEVLQHDYYMDFLCYDEIVVELKAVKELEDVHRAQLLNYLRAGRKKLGFLMNFHGSACKIERIVNYALLNEEE